MSKAKLCFSLILLIVFTFTACSPTNNQNDQDPAEPIGMANPASVYCIENGGTLEIHSSADGEYGVCIFNDGSECEEWAYFRGECQSGGESQSSAELMDEVRTTQVVAWYGRVISTDQYGRAEHKLVIAPDGIGEVYLAGEKNEIGALIRSLSDKEPPGNYANFWGELTCIGDDPCILTASLVRVDGPGDFYSADMVEGWEGTLITTRTEPGSGGDDCLVVSGEYDIQYGIHGADESIDQLIDEYKTSGKTVRIWGELTAGIPDWNNTQILVSRIEVVE